DHGSKHIDRQEFLRLIQDQLDGEKAHANCKPINASGHIGHLVKIHLLSHGYTLVTKAQLHQRRVMHRDAAPRNMLYDARTGKYMIIDLELSEPIDGGVPEAVDVHIQKRKRKE
ncbi:hypothetical protein E4U58_001547, partial [Claviceps cyperi]